MSTILILASYGPSLENFRGSLIKEFIRTGHRVVACAPDILPETEQNLSSMGAEVRETPFHRDGKNILDDITYFRNIRSLIKAEQADLVLTYTIKPNIWGALAARSRGVRSVSMITGLGYAFTDTGYKPGLGTRLLRTAIRRLYRLATNANWKIFFQNTDDPVDFKKAGCLGDTSKIRIVNGSGIDLAQFPQRPMPDDFETAPVFLMIARLLHNKGVIEYVQAATKVKQNMPTARFMLVGPEDTGPDGIDSRLIPDWTAVGIEYLGAQDDVRPFIEDCHVFVLPSYREGTPRSNLEAMATGRPILTTDVPGCRATVVQGGNGFLVPVRDPDALADAMQHLIDTPHLTEIMALKSRQIAEDKYDVNKVNAFMLAEMDL
jgi:glycosyltransferase involved in cell wall biosynthesis